MNAIAQMGHNQGPDPIDEATAPFEDVRSEAEGWLDGKLVENEAQMKAVDTLIKDMKGARKAIDTARDTATKPLHEMWKGEIARWKPTQDDFDRIVAGLVAIVDPFKRKLAAEKEAARKEAERLAWEVTRAAQEASRIADAGNIEATRAAAVQMQEAETAQALAMAAQKDTVKGMRTVTKYEVTDRKALLNWIAVNDRDAVTAFIDEWARKNHKTTTANGLDVWQETEAY